MNILLPTDGSRYAVAAARFVARHGRIADARIDLVGIYPKGGANDTRQWFERTAKPLENHGVTITRRARRGIPAKVITELAQDRSYDLVVIGAKGRSDTPFFDVGSVALAVLEHVPSNVLMVRERTPTRRRRQVASKLNPLRVLMPTDGKPPILRAARDVVQVFDFAHLEMEVVTVLDTAALRPLNRMSRGQRDAFLQALKAEAEACLQEASALLEELGMPPSAMHQIEGNTAESIIEMAEQSPSDLIVLGSRGVKRIAERHLGSVALEVARAAPCSVFVARDS